MKKEMEQFLTKEIAVILQKTYFKKVIILTEHKEGISLLYGSLDREEESVDDIFNDDLASAISNVIDARRQLKEERDGKKTMIRGGQISYIIDSKGKKYE